MADEKRDIERVEQPNLTPDSRKSAENGSHTLDELKQTDTIDTVHNDEALRVLAAYAGEETWTAEEEKRVVKKIDRRLLPLLVLTYGLQYYDKGSF